MVTATGVISRSPCQALLRTAAWPRARQGLLNRKVRWTSNEERARPHQLPYIGQRLVKKTELGMFRDIRKFIRSIDSKSLPARKELVGLVDSEVECLCSWNPASGPKRAIHVPGDASRPRTASLPPTDPTTYGPPDPTICEPSSQACRSGEDSQSFSWYDALTALCAMKPNEKLDNVDIMVHHRALIQLLGIPLWRARALLSGRSSAYAFDMSLINNTLVIQERPEIKPLHTGKALATRHRWDCWKAATVPVPQVDYGASHSQLLRYNIGSLSCVVQAEASGTVQELPSTKEPSGPPKTRNIHGIDVITAGQGVLTPLAFQASVRRPCPDANPRRRKRREFERFRRWAPDLWVCGQTKLGIVDAITPGQDASAGGLTVVELGDLVRKFENRSQDGLRRLVGLLEILRDTVRAHGGPCVAVFCKLKDDPDPGPPNIHVYSAGPKKVPVLLDWHKGQFWSNRSSTNQHVGLQRKATNKDTRPQNGFIGRWASWLGF